MATKTKSKGKYAFVIEGVQKLAKAYKKNPDAQFLVERPQNVSMQKFKYRLQAVFYNNGLQSLLPSSKMFVKYETDCGNIVIVVEDRGER